MKTNADNDKPVNRATSIRESLEEIISRLRENIGGLKDPREKALFEVSAEVLTGLQKAFTDFEEGSEDAWKK